MGYAGWPQNPRDPPVSASLSAGIIINMSLCLAFLHEVLGPHAYTR